MGRRGNPCAACVRPMTVRTPATRHDQSVRRWRIFGRRARTMLLDNAKGNYKFIRGYGAPFSSGALADPGFEIVHASFKPLARLADGYGLIERHMRDAGRPINAVCGIELRIPAALTPAGFDEFNRPYIERLKAWD